MNLINNYDLFIFDLDDTIIKTEKYHYNAWLKTLKLFINDDFYIDFNNYCLKFHSKEKNNIKKYLLDELGLNNYISVIDYKNKIYLELLNKENEKLKLIDGLEKLLELIIINKKKFIIVTNTLKLNIDFLINLFSILKN
jgi:beta-phosphoglucomutase-like phosphatase (HAD superfamily)